MIPELSDEKGRRHRYTLSDLLVFDRKHDGIILALTVVPALILWFVAHRSSCLESVVKNNSANHNIRMYEIMFSHRNRSTLEGSYTASNVFPLYPVLLSIPQHLKSTMQFSVQLLSIGLSALLNLAFYRLCLTLPYVTDPFITASLFTFYPLRSLLLRHIGNEYSLVLLCICGVFIGQRIHRQLLFSLSIFFLVLTNELGIWIAIGLLIDPLFARNRIGLKNVAIPFAAALLLLAGFQSNFAGSFVAYYRAIRTSKAWPFKQLFQDAKSIEHLRQFHGFYGYFIIPVIAVSTLIAVDRKIGIPMVFPLLAAAARSGVASFDLAAPIEAFASLLAFDGLIKTRRFHLTLAVLGPLYGILGLWVTSFFMRNRSLYIN
jgi:hypothetical protein